MAPAPLFSAWHEFFALIGAAAATLIGAMFVVVSIGMGILSRDRFRAIGAFLSATVIHLTAVLLGSALTLVPGLDWWGFGVAAGLAGIAGLVYAANIIRGFGEHPHTGLDDWFWYAICPPVCYAALLAAGIMALRGAAASRDLFAAVVVALLLLGIRNAWDMIVFLVTRNRDTT